LHPYLPIQLLVLAFIAVDAAAATSASSLSTDRNERELLSIQQKVDELFQQGEYERALFIYQHELAPLGDKYAQYMIGFMYLTGAGVAEDAVTASAWYRLAAERGNREFSAVRDELLQRLGTDELAKSDELYVELRKQYSDIAILVRQIRNDDEDLRLMTGSRLSDTGGSVTIVHPRSGATKTAHQWRREIRKSIEDRLETLDRLMPDADIETDYTKVDLDELDRLVELELAKTPDR
jgi:hypothetical protein